jgi:tRNA(Ile2) C34 agmatinyltransferase TiaS
MKLYLGFDDTDALGAQIDTGRLAGLFAERPFDGCRLWGVVRQQLLLNDQIPFTSQNSAACVVMETENESSIPALISGLIERASTHIEELASPGSAPGLCVVRGDADVSQLMAFGQSCALSVESLGAAREAAARAGAHLSGQAGLIGAAAAVGLTLYGWSGRLLDYGDLRAMPDPISVGQLRALGVRAVAIDRSAKNLPPETLIHAGGGLSPRLWGGEPAALVRFARDRCVPIGKRPRDAKFAE